MYLWPQQIFCLNLVNVQFVLGLKLLWKITSRMTKLTSYICEETKYSGSISLVSSIKWISVKQISCETQWACILAFHYRLRDTKSPKQESKLCWMEGHLECLGRPEVKQSVLRAWQDTGTWGAQRLCQPCDNRQSFPRGVVKYWDGCPWGRTAIQRRVLEGGGNANWTCEWTVRRLGMCPRDINCCRRMPIVVL